MKNLKTLLYTEGSLTQAISDYFKHPVGVDVLREELRPAFTDEQNVLGDTLLWSRDVILTAPEPVVLANTRIAHKDLQGALAPLKKLGNQALGEWLFAQPDLQKATVRIDEATRTRETQYQVQDAIIWVKEVFVL